MIIIIDCNIGNVGSIKNMINRIGFDCIISNKLSDIENSSKLILPGVGSFDNGITNLKKLNLFKPINNKVLIEKTPILGICLGMQIMTKFSEEGTKKGFGWINTNVKKIKKSDCNSNIPVMGWNYISSIKDNPIINKDKQRYYFVHSYYIPKETPGSIATASVGFEYCVAFQKENIFGVQFHPEKSHVFGKKMLSNFCSI